MLLRTYKNKLIIWVTLDPPDLREQLVLQVQRETKEKLELINSFTAEELH